MPSLTSKAIECKFKDIPSEGRCKHIILKLVVGFDACPRCGCSLTFKRGTTYGWCKTCRHKFSPKAHTWFHHSKLTYKQVFQLLWCWQHKKAPGDARDLVDVSYPTVRRWYERFRTYLPYKKYPLLASFNKLHDLVAIDESFFGKQRYGGQTIVAGAIEVASRRLRLRIIPDTTMPTIEQFVTSNIEKGTHLITDCARSYGDLEYLGYTRDYFNHSRFQFELSNHIECIWSSLKRHLRHLYGCIRTKELSSVLNEWEARFNDPTLFESPTNYLEKSVVPV